MIELVVVALGLGLALYGPGYVVGRGLGCSPFIALTTAPISSLFCWLILTTLWDQLDIACSAWLVVGPTLALGLVLYVIRCLLHKRTAYVLDCPPLPKGCNARLLTIGCVVGYALVSAVIAGCFFLGNIAAPDAIMPYFDNGHHLARIRLLADSGEWNTFASFLYGSQETYAPFTDVKFYPSAWFWLGAVAVNGFGVSAPLAENAAIFLTMACIMPWSTLLLARTIFAEHPRVIVAGALFILAFTAFPWRILSFGPLYPNLFSWSLSPAVAALFIRLTAPGCRRLGRALAAGLFIMGLAALVVAQPNGLFTMAVFLIPYVVWRVSAIPTLFTQPGALQIGLRILFGLIGAIFIALFWWFLHGLPFMDGVVNYLWPSYYSFVDAIKSMGLLFFDINLLQTRQWALALLVVAGAITTLVWRRYLWVTLAYGLIALIYVVDVVMEGPLKSLLAGFWYTDPRRIAATAVGVATLLAALGFAGFWELICWALAKAFGLGERRGSGKEHVATLRAKLSGVQEESSDERKGYRVLGSAPSVGVFVILAALTLVTTFSPTQLNGEEGPFGVYGSFLQGDTAGTKNGSNYDNEERAFMKEVADLVDGESVIVNIAPDGSAFAYGDTGLPLLYREFMGYDGEHETEDGRLIRHELATIASNEEVQRAVEDAGARYVLMLDQGRPADGTMYDLGYLPERWAGIEAISEDTPGFKLLLSDGDMRLYEIVPEEFEEKAA